VARILAIDFGMKRCGIAVTDPLQLIASPMQTVENDRLLDFLQAYFGQEEVEAIVIGDPRRLDNAAQPLGAAVRELKTKLQEKFPGKNIFLVDERFTSSIARQVILQSGLKKKDRRDKSLTDKVSASLLLQHYLDTVKR
jgi:putative Holliday junction resolvase